MDFLSISLFLGSTDTNIARTLVQGLQYPGASCRRKATARSFRRYEIPLQLAAAWPCLARLRAALFRRPSGQRYESRHFGKAFCQPWARPRGRASKTGLSLAARRHILPAAEAGVHRPGFRHKGRPGHLPGIRQRASRYQRRRQAGETGLALNSRRWANPSP